MERVQNKKLKDTKLCSKYGCIRNRIYFIKSKNKIVCNYCYQNFYLDEEKTTIEDHKGSEQIVSKIDSDIDMMKDHGVKYSIIEFYPDYFIELRIFEDKLKKISSKLKKAQDNDDFIKYPEIEEEGYSLLKELKSSKVSRDFEVHYSQISLYIRSNENLSELDDPLQSEIRDKRLSKAKEDLAQAMQEQLSQAIKEEKEKVKLELEERYNQIYLDQKKKIEEQDAMIAELSTNNDCLYKNISKMSTELEDLKTEHDTLNEEFENLKTVNSNLNTERDSLKVDKDTLVTELSNLKTDVNNLKLENTNLEESSKKNEEDLNKNIDKINKENKINKDKIEKLEEEAKKQLIENDNMTRCLSDLGEYLPYFYKLKTGRDGKSGSEFYMEIDWQKDTDKQVFGLAKAVKSRQMRKITICNFKSEENKDILNYLINNCPEQLRIFVFDSDTDEGYCSGDYYLEGIQKVSSVTSKEISLRLFKFSKEAFETTMKASSNSDRIVFNLCQIDLSSDIDLSGPEYKTTYLSFMQVGDRKANDWKNHPERIKRVIKAISMCSLKNSLKTINVYKSDVEVKTVEEMLKEFKLDGIQVIDDAIKALNE